MYLWRSWCLAKKIKAYQSETGRQSLSQTKHSRHHPLGKSLRRGCGTSTETEDIHWTLIVRCLKCLCVPSKPIARTKFLKAPRFMVEPDQAEKGVPDFRMPDLKLRREVRLLQLCPENLFHCASPSLALKSNSDLSDEINPGRIWALSGVKNMILYVPFIVLVAGWRLPLSASSALTQDLLPSLKLPPRPSVLWESNYESKWCRHENAEEYWPCVFNERPVDFQL